MCIVHMEVLSLLASIIPRLHSTALSEEKKCGVEPGNDAKVYCIQSKNLHLKPVKIISLFVTYMHSYRPTIWLTKLYCRICFHWPL